MFEFFYGNVGSGKTLHAVYDAWKDWARGRRIFANIHLNIPDSQYVRPIDILTSLNPKLTTNPKFTTTLLNDRTPKTLLLQEIGKWWNKRTHSSQANRFINYFVDQCRKRNINLIVDDQHLTGYDVDGRSLTDILTRCQGHYLDRDRTIPIAFEYWQLHLDEYDSTGKRKMIHYKIPWELAQYICGNDKKGIVGLYNTFEHTVPIEMLQEDIEEIKLSEVIQ